jgi:hypothetical protein
MPFTRTQGPCVAVPQRLANTQTYFCHTKLFGYDLTVEYRAEKLNIVADALSCRDSEAPTVRAVSGPTFALYDDLWVEHQCDPQAQELRAQLAAGTAPDGWALVDDMLLHRGRLFIPDASVL